ncbi:MAG: hypothetical protein U0840_25735 [Gemmataceae bacterium]
MSTAAGFYLSWLRLTGPEVKPAEVTFDPGLNVFWGASETGKSFIFTCIDFMLGRSTPPKNIYELDGYTTGWLGFTERTGRKQRVLERGLKGGDFRLYAADGKDWTLSSPETLHPEHSSSRTDTISHLLLSMSGLEKAVLLMAKGKGKTRQISFRDVAHATMVDENRIINELPPVYPTGQRDAKTGELATFTYLISGNDWRGVIAGPDIKVEKATWKGKTELYEQLIAEIQREVGEKPPSPTDIAAQIAACDTRITEVATKIEESNKLITEWMATRKTAWEGSQQAQTRIAVIEQLKDRFEQLLKHYQSDVQRLQFISEGDFFLAQLGAPHCPFCGLPLEGHSVTRLQEEAAKGSIQEAAASEAKKIFANVRDLEKTLAGLDGEHGQLGVHVSRRQKEISDAEKTIRQELEPRVVADKKELSELVERRGKLLSLQGALGRLADFTARRAALGKEPKQKRGGAGQPSANPDFGRLRQLADEIAAILKEWRYLKTGVVDFDDEFDVVANGQPRRNRGKGIRAVLHSAFTIGIMKHCETQKLPHTGMLLLDSPLTSYKEKDYQEVTEDIQVGFFEYLLKLPEYQQVIVFENKEPPAAVLRRMRQTHFSGTPNVNRAGFIPEQNEPSDGDGFGDGDGLGDGAGGGSND